MDQPNEQFSKKELKLIFECVMDCLINVEQRITDERSKSPQNIAEITHLVKKRHDIIGFLPVLRDYAD